MLMFMLLTIFALFRYISNRSNNALTFMLTQSTKISQAKVGWLS